MATARDLRMAEREAAGEGGEREGDDDSEHDVHAKSSRVLQPYTIQDTPLRHPVLPHVNAALR